MKENKLWVLKLIYSGGCEAEVSVEVILGIFESKEKAEDWIEYNSRYINWDYYYQGTWEIEEYDFNPVNFIPTEKQRFII